ncbi:Oxoglutarate/iron-dependent dioxygenase - like 2 [Theobroma cacao]|nr:Oxoglutarate/iron-dependent dioxygenase - like 2 [Theobroma cacao]
MFPGSALMAPSTITALAEEKTLQASFVRDEDERPKVAYNKFNNEIPVISLAGIDDVDGKRAEIRKKIVEACENWEKLRFDMSGAKKGGFIVSNHLKGEAVQHWRELVAYFSYPLKARDYSRWPDKPEGWVEVTKEYSDKLMGLACKLLEVLPEAMDLDKEALTKWWSISNPKCPQPYLTVGLKRHTDPSTITLLLQNQVGGLQATSDNVWAYHKVTEFICGEQYLSNGRFKNADHQAVVNSDCSILSIATFQNPAPDATVYPLKIRKGEKINSRGPITFAEMYRRKMNKDQELARLKKLAKEQQQLQEIVKTKLEAKPLEKILA